MPTAYDIIKRAFNKTEKASFGDVGDITISPEEFLAYKQGRLDAFQYALEMMDDTEDVSLQYYDDKTSSQMFDH